MRWALGLAIVPLLTGCFGRPPLLARDLPPLGFSDRVTQRFPEGSDEQALVAELCRERFGIVGSVARYELQGLPCKRTWTIVWKAEDGRITDIQGREGQICL